MCSSVVEVLVDDTENNPHCLHGPTLLFRRLKGKAKEYYACSACRDRKDCNFFLQAGRYEESYKITLSNHWKKQQELAVSESNNKNLRLIYKKLLNIFKKKTSKNENSQNNDNNMKSNQNKSNKAQANYCYTCGCLFIDSEDRHENCNVLSNLTLFQLTHPTKIITPKVNAKTHAQYFFSKTSVEDILLLITRLNISRVLCIGTPRMHEFILNNYSDKIKSLLLDIDISYTNFYNKNEFIWYNMFNNHIFDVEQKPVLHKFLNSGRIIILLDPPFGGRVEPLAYTLKRLSKMVLDNKKFYEGNFWLDTFWFFPYFMEQHILRSLPQFKMFDYKVNYENHTSFTNIGKRKRKFGSPVRIFTNVSLSLLNLNGISGYKYCELCNCWVSTENRHCKSCQSCTSKDGRTYIHCSNCGKCVKPSYKHCDQCERCCLPEHVCGAFQPDPNCYHCHQPGHKKNQCPQVNEENFKERGERCSKRRKTK